MKSFRIFALAVASALGAISCGGHAGDAVRPSDFKGTAAAGIAPPTCSGAPRLARPLVVDIDADARVDLEAAMKKGLVVVSYDCASLRVMPACKAVDGNYDYAGVSRKEQVVQMKGLDDLRVNLPLSAGKLGGEVQSGRTIELGLVYVGRRTTVVGAMRADELTGACEGATHYIQSATVGAFSMATGSTGKVTAVADLFHVGASGASESSRSVASRDGSLDACRSSDPDSTAPPAECRSPLRVELTPIASPPPASAKIESVQETPKAKTVEPSPCQPGYVFNDGICTKSPEGAFLCDPGDRAQCKAQCEKGSGGSCFNSASFSPDEAKAYYAKGCALDHAESCNFQALGMKTWGGADESTHLPEFVAMVQVFTKGCNLGSGNACMHLGYARRATASKTTYDLAAGFKAFVRGCSLGDGAACSQVAEGYLEGRGVAQDIARGLDFYAKACQSGDEEVCQRFAGALRFGGTAPKDLPRALKIYAKLCESSAWDCQSAAEVLVELGRNDEALRYAKKSCDGDANGDGRGCMVLADIYASGKGAPKNVAAAKEIYARVCAGSPTSPACEKEAALGAPPGKGAPRSKPRGNKR